MNGWEKPFRKNRIINSNNQGQIALMWKKTTSRKANFCSNTVYSLYCKIRVEKITRHKTTHFFITLQVSA